MSPSLVVATAQSSISADVSENGRNIRALMCEARSAGADLVHFPEGALSGYVKSQIRDWWQVDWSALDKELARTAELAGELGLWVVVGSNHRLPAPYRPHNSLYVLSLREGLSENLSESPWSAAPKTLFLCPRFCITGEFLVSEKEIFSPFRSWLECINEG